MPWNTQGGGGSPWGSGGGGRGQGPWGSGGGGGFGGPQQPNLEEMLRRAQEKLKSIFPGGGGSSRGIILILLIAVAIWLASGFYRVQPDEQGVVLRFGEWVRNTEPGLNYHLPAPMESALTPKVTVVNRVDIGFRSTGQTSGAGARNVPEESLMLTGDENIVDINFVVFWVINDAGKYLFNIRNPEQTVKAAAESAMREIIGRTNIQPILAEGRAQVEVETQRLLQQVLDSYGAGIQITQLQMQRADPPPQVVDAFRDVQSARADLERQRNEAQAYRNDLIPRARGEAAQIVQAGEAYKRQTVAQAQGDSSRFLALYGQYSNAPQVTRQRLYLETMQDVLTRNPSVIIDSRVGGNGVVPYLPLPEIQKRMNTERSGSGGTAGSSAGGTSATQGGTR